MAPTPSSAEDRPKPHEAVAYGAAGGGWQGHCTGCLEHAPEVRDTETAAEADMAAHVELHS